jgi:purine nucleosidase
LSATEVRQRFQTTLLQPVLDFAEVWFQSRPAITFHDPLAAATLFDEQICRFERGHVDVECSSEHHAGLTRWESRDDGRHEVAMSVDGDRFFEHYFAVVK